MASGSVDRVMNGATDDAASVNVDKLMKGAPDDIASINVDEPMSGAPDDIKLLVPPAKKVTLGHRSFKYTSPSL